MISVGPMTNNATTNAMASATLRFDSHWIPCSIGLAADAMYAQESASSTANA